MAHNRINQSISAQPLCVACALAQPRHIRGPWTTAILLLTLLLLAGYFSPTARAETITLPCEVDAAANQKRLIKAIDMANSTGIADTIVLPVNCQYRFDAPLVGNGFDALPVITNTLTIDGNGATLRANPDVVGPR